MRKIIIIGILVGYFWHFDITAQKVAQVPYSTGFEEQDDFSELESWFKEREEPGGVIEIVDTEDSFFPDADAYKGTSSLMIRSDIVTGIGTGIHQVITDATFKIDLSENKSYFLEGAWKAVFEKEGASCINEFSDFEDEDNEGIFISEDEGENYVKVKDFPEYGEWNDFKLNLNRLAEQRGFQLNDKIRIKFQSNCVYGEEYYSNCLFKKFLLIDEISVNSTSGGSGNEDNGDNGYKVCYSYDKAGNRTGHYVEVVLENKSATMEEDEDEPYSELNGEDEIIIFPNPTEGEIFIGIQGNSDEVNYSYKLFNLQGSLLLNGEFNSYGKFPLNMQRFKPGVYMLIISNSHNEFRYKIIKK